MNSNKKQYIGQDKLQVMGFVLLDEAIDANLYVLKRGKTIIATIALDNQGYVKTHHGLIVCSKSGYVQLYQRF